MRRLDRGGGLCCSGKRLGLFGVENKPDLQQLRHEVSSKKHTSLSEYANRSKSSDALYHLQDVFPDAERSASNAALPIPWRGGPGRVEDGSRRS
eukprot:9048442-Pyramimonas_sp.AAC.1